MKSMLARWLSMASV